MPSTTETLDVLARKFRSAWQDIPACVPGVLEEGLEFLRTEPHPFRTLSRVLQDTSDTTALFAVMLTGEIDHTPRTFHESFCRRWMTRNHGEAWYVASPPQMGREFVRVAWQLLGPEKLFHELKKYLHIDHDAVATDALEAFFWWQIALKKKGVYEDFASEIDAQMQQFAQDFLASQSEPRLDNLALVLSAKHFSADLTQKIKVKAASLQGDVEDVQAMIAHLFPVRGTDNHDWAHYARAFESSQTVAAEAAALLDLAMAEDWKWFAEALEDASTAKFAATTLSVARDVPTELCYPLFLALAKTREFNQKAVLRGSVGVWGAKPVLLALQRLRDEFPDYAGWVSYMAYYVAVGQDSYLARGSGVDKDPTFSLRIPNSEECANLKRQLGG